MELATEKRTLLGKKVKSLRKKGLVPAVIFGKKKKSIPIQVRERDLERAFAKAGESALINLNIADSKSTKSVIISEIQRDPVKDKIIHANFHEVDLKEKITAPVPVELVGESPAVKSGKGILITLLDEIEVECLPTDLPQSFKIDVSKLEEVDQSIEIKDLKYDREKIQVNHDPKDLVVKIEYAEQLEEEEEEKGPESVEEIEAIKERPKEEEEGTEKEEGENAKPKESEEAA